MKKDEKYFYDIHCHLSNLSHLGILALLRRTLHRKGIDFFNLIRKHPNLCSMTAFLLPFLITKKMISRSLKTSVNNIINAFAIGEKDIAGQLLALEEDLINIDKGTTAGHIVLNNNVYKKVILTPLIIDYYNKNNTLKDIHYNKLASKPIVEQVTDLFNGIKEYSRKSKLKIFRIYPFLGINTMSYDMGCMIDVNDHKILPKTKKEFEQKIWKYDFLKFKITYLIDENQPGDFLSQIIIYDNIEFPQNTNSKDTFGKKIQTFLKSALTQWGNKIMKENKGISTRQSALKYAQEQLKKNNTIPKILTKYFDTRDIKVGKDKMKWFFYNYEQNFDTPKPKNKEDVMNEKSKLPLSIKNDFFTTHIYTCNAPTDKINPRCKYHKKVKFFLKKTENQYENLATFHLLKDCPEKKNTLYKKDFPRGFTNLLKYHGDIDKVGPYFFLGIKLYPPVGFDPWPEQEKEKQKVCFLYQFCQKNQIPITVHCGYGGYNTAKNWKKLTDPSKWKTVLSHYGNLKVNFAHMGIHDSWKNIIPWSINEIWVKQIFGLIQKYPNIYTDISCHLYNKRFCNYLKHLFDIYEKEKNDPGLKEIKDLKDRILFGTDYIVSLFEIQSYKAYYENFFKHSPFCKENQKNEFIKKITEDNPARFLFGEKQKEKNNPAWKKIVKKIENDKNAKKNLPGKQLTIK